MTTTKLSKNLVMILAIVTSGFLLTAIFATPSLFVNAVMQQNMGGKSMMNNGHQMNGVYANNIPQINGTLNLKNNTNITSIKNMSIPFLTAFKVLKMQLLMVQ